MYFMLFAIIAPVLDYVIHMVYVLSLYKKMFLTFSRVWWGMIMNVYVPRGEPVLIVNIWL